MTWLIQVQFAFIRALRGRLTLKTGFFKPFRELSGVIGSYRDIKNVKTASGFAFIRACLAEAAQRRQVHSWLKNPLFPFRTPHSALRVPNALTGLRGVTRSYEDLRGHKKCKNLPQFVFIRPCLAEADLRLPNSDLPPHLHQVAPTCTNLRQLAQKKLADEHARDPVHQNFPWAGLVCAGVGCWTSSVGCWMFDVQARSHPWSCLVLFGAVWRSLVLKLIKEGNLKAFPIQGKK